MCRERPARPAGPSRANVRTIAASSASTLPGGDEVPGRSSRRRMTHPPAAGEVPVPRPRGRNTPVAALSGPWRGVAAPRPQTPARNPVGRARGSTASRLGDRLFPWGACRRVSRVLHGAPLGRSVSRPLPLGPERRSTANRGSSPSPLPASVHPNSPFSRASVDPFFPGPAPRSSAVRREYLASSLLRQPRGPSHPTFVRSTASPRSAMPRESRAWNAGPRSTEHPSRPIPGNWPRLSSGSSCSSKGGVEGKAVGVQVRVGDAGPTGRDVRWTNSA